MPTPAPPRSSRRVRRGSLADHRHINAAAVAAPGDYDQPVEQHHTEIEIDWLPAVEEAVGIGIVERLDTDDLRTGRQPGDGELAERVEREAGDELARRQVEDDHVRREQSLTVL